MPLVRVSAVAEILTPETKRKICREMHDVIMRNTSSPSEVVWVMIDEVPADGWMVHETMLSDKLPGEIFEKD